MPYDVHVTRAILREFGAPADTGDYIRTDNALLSPPYIAGFSQELVPERVDRLVEIGLLRRTREIRMKNHPDPVTLRATESGGEWVRRAWSDSDRRQSVPSLQHLLEAGDAA